MGLIKRNTGEAQVIQQGIALPTQPKHQPPDLPRDPTELDDASLMGIWTEFTAWTDYMAVQVAIAYSDEKRLAKKIERMEQRALLKGDKVTVARAEIKASDEHEKLAQEWLEAEAYRKLLEALFNNYDRDAALLSRELTRRTGDVKSRQRTWQP
jgi:hypothetical protein